jgi:hypothetical protein
VLKKRTNPTPHSSNIKFGKKKSPMQPCTLIIPYSNMKLLKPQPNTLMQFLKIETTMHGYVGMAHTML